MVDSRFPRLAIVLGALLALGLRPSFADDAADAEDVAAAVAIRPVFTDMTLTGWEPSNDDGLPTAFRPIVLIHAGDDSGRLFLADEWGVIHVFTPGDGATQVFLDIRDRVSYKDNQNEEGLLGLAFHPNYAENGQFFVYYTAKDKPNTSIVSRFHVSGDDANVASPESEEQILEVPQPFWNHNSGNILFGPDGMLYVSLGDGGAGGDPLKNGQNLGTLFATVLRIDVDREEDGRAYGIPSDNPFVDREGARGEIWAYGFRNLWGLTFDRETGLLWGADVGQDIWEEINLVEKGGNYGWSLRESMHPFGEEGAESSDGFVEPIFEYHHDVGKSITGGFVYRGSKIPELQGCYVYADYVSKRVWALKYDHEAKQVVFNQELAAPDEAVMAFGEDAEGELYLMAASGAGRGVYRFEPAN